MQFTNTHVHVHTYFSLSCFLSLEFSCPPVFLVSCFLCRVFSPSSVFFCESPQEFPSIEAFTKNLKLPRRRAVRRHTTGCSSATIKCFYFSLPFISQRISPKRSRNSLRQWKSTRQTFANRVPYLGLLGRLVEVAPSSVHANIHANLGFLMIGKFLDRSSRSMIRGFST
jgi:hypothetical protein